MICVQHSTVVFSESEHEYTTIGEEMNGVAFHRESEFNIPSGNCRIFIWRKRVSQNNPAFMQDSVSFEKGEMMI